MRVGINAFFLSQPATGSGQYTHHLLKALARAEPGNEVLPLAPHARLQAVPTCHLPPSAFNLQPLTCIAQNLAKVWFEQVSFPRACRRRSVDVAHVPYFAPPRCPPVPTVVTIHDLIPMLLDAYRGSALVRAYTRLVATGARRARAIIADSECSKRDIVRLLGIPPQRVHVIYLAAEERLQPVEDEVRLGNVRRRYGLPERYVLYLGGLDQRKNVLTLIRAFARTREVLDDPHRLVIAGRLPERESPLFPDPRRVVAELGLGEAVRFVGWVAEEDKPALYSGAACFVYPSLYEGFGLPPLEAMACGAPVIASNASSLPEVVGDAGLLVAPQDVDALAEAMIAVLSDEELRASLRQKGAARAKRFSWEKTARETLGVYERLIRDNDLQWVG
jgi:glycosyltransferase involved in cell wall biosynthesis